MILDRIQKANDIKEIDPEDYDALAGEIREFLVNKISRSGGHLGSNLGAVELTMALHLVAELPKDKIIWDVGHQSYTHKLLTGRREGFDKLRKYGGMSGFPKRAESECDAFDTGHSSTSVSAGLGLVKARDIKGEDYAVFAVIGDGALTGGMAYEALNNAARLKTNYVIILNDNAMSIAENVGGVSKYLTRIRTMEPYRNFKVGLEDSLLKVPKAGERVLETLKRYKSGFKQLVVPGMFFEDMGLTYLGPVDGHDVRAMRRMFLEARKIKKCVIVHVITRKGKGYLPAERHPARFHGAEPFDTETGLPLVNRKKANYTDVFSTVMTKLGARNEKVCAITAAMPDGTGLKRFSNMYPERFFDVGIAEQHAVTFAAGLAAGGLRPIVAVYSSFLQRAYDQILHDVCIQNLPVIFCIDRAGLVGSDGETHQGIFDISYLSSIPNMSIMAPKNKWELSDMMKFALNYDKPISIRYPRGEAYDGLKDYRSPIEYGKSEVICNEGGVALFALGSMVKTAEAVRDILKLHSRTCSIINARFAKPLDEELLRKLARDHSLIVTMEENVYIGGMGEQVREFVDSQELGARVLSIALPDDYVEHGNVELLKKETGIDADSAAEKIMEYLGVNNEKQA
ncbi:MAG TPA: 1-deoxy-D-xylulose-5-phosphate synthase [Lachnospiraceae bacterium]|nr:1-deoxy-D-xylulose-5-phosphate synthase [Lachnospiraceae bacterium]HAU99901.1 1-deoxy-D-xylulose-5-phosphate synthase [Lachnospiraceae bacterium]